MKNVFTISLIFILFSCLSPPIKKGEIKEDVNNEQNLNVEENTNDPDNLGTIPVIETDNEEHFYTFTKEMLISKENLSNDTNNILYGEYEFNNGIVTEVHKEFVFFLIKLTDTNPNTTASFSGFKNGEIIKIFFDEVQFMGNSEMCHACDVNLKELIVSGRRVKFSFVEGYPGCGNAMGGVLFLTFIEVLR